MTHITRETGLDALYGGWFLGGGGGGLISGGFDVLDAVMENGGFDICTFDDLKDDETVLTASLVGAPSAGKITADHCRRVCEIYKEYTGSEIGAFITNEAGGHAISNGWIAASVSGTPVVDAACHGRAFPTGTMGSLSLDEDPQYQTIQCCVGGSGNTYVELFEKGSVSATASLIRSASVAAGGFVTVLRNPVSAGYARANAAPGALSMSMAIGKILRANEGNADAIIGELADQYDLRVLAKGTIDSFDLTCTGGFDVGTIRIGKDAEATFWNEFMTAEIGGERLATFPDLIALLRADNGMPICSAEVEKGMDVFLVVVPKSRLLLGSALFLPRLYVPCEKATGKEIIAYSFG